MAERGLAIEVAVKDHLYNVAVEAALDAVEALAVDADIDVVGDAAESAALDATLDAGKELVALVKELVKEFAYTAADEAVYEVCPD